VNGFQKLKNNWNYKIAHDVYLITIFYK